jgi:hypothetical protein
MFLAGIFYGQCWNKDLATVLLLKDPESSSGRLVRFMTGNVEYSENVVGRDLSRQQ